MEWAVRSSETGEGWDGARAVDATSGELRYRVRGDRLVDVSSGSPDLRLTDDGRVLDLRSGVLMFRVRDDGRVVDANSGELRLRLRR